MIDRKCPITDNRHNGAMRTSHRSPNSGAAPAVTAMLDDARQQGHERHFDGVVDPVERNKACDAFESGAAQG